MANQIDPWKITSAVMAGMTAILSWLGIDSLLRLRSLERLSISRGEFKEYMDSMREDRKAMHEEDKAQIVDLKKSVDSIQTAGVLAMKVLQCEREINRLRKWRHEKADPYIIAMDQLNERMMRLEQARS